jgi:hypothetical protein
MVFEASDVDVGNVIGVREFGGSGRSVDLLAKGGCWWRKSLTLAWR